MQGWLYISLWITLMDYMVGDNSLLSSTLFTFQDFACHEELLKLHCPQGSTISIQWAQYGRLLPSTEMCPYSGNSFMQQNTDNENTNCLATTSLAVVLEICQDQRSCKVQASTETFRSDPCKNTSKYLEVAFKCRPNEFRSRVSCEGETMHLQCQPGRRIAIYSSMFGWTKQGSVQCPQGTQPLTDCRSKCSLDVVMNLCHGRRKCEIAAAENIFTNPCPEGTNNFLSVVYTCVPKRILKMVKKKRPRRLKNYFCGKQDKTSSKNGRDNKNSGPGQNGANKNISGSEINGQAGHKPKPSTYLTPLTPPGLIKNDSRSSSHNISEEECLTVDPPVPVLEGEPVGVVQDWMWTINFLKKNRERFILYAVIGGLTGLVLVLFAMVFQLMWVRRRQGRRAKLDISEPVPNQSTLVQSQDLTTLDSSPDQMNGVEILRYNHSTLGGRTSTFRAETPTRRPNSFYDNDFIDAYG